MKITFLFPTITEIPPALKISGMKGGRFYEMENYNLLCTGPGRNIELTMERHAQKLKDCFLVLCGFGGALKMCLAPGDVVLCDNFSYKKMRLAPENDKELPLQEMCLAPNSNGKFIQKIEKLGDFVHRGDCLTSDCVISNAEHKKRIGEHSSSLVVDMENYWFAMKACEWKCSFLAFRVIVDSVGENLPDMMGTLTATGDIFVWGTAWHIIRYPTHLYSMWKIFRRTSLLLERLEKCCEVILCGEPA